MKDSHIITGFVILGAAVINLYLSQPAPSSSQPTAVAATEASYAATGPASAGENCEDAASPLVKAVAPPCPVMDMKVTTKNHKSTYKGKTYYFCCASCIPKFDVNPAMYVSAVDRGVGGTS